MALTRSSAQDITLRVGPLANLPELVRSLGKDPKPIIQANGLTEQCFQNPENRVPFIQVSQFLERCVEFTGVEHLGLLLGQMATASHLGLTGFLAQTAPSAGAALQELVDNLDLHDQGGIASLHLGSHHSSLRYSLLLGDTCAVEQIYDLSAVMMYKIMRALCGAQWCADIVNLGRHRPADTKPYDNFFNTQIYFNATESAITFRNSWLESVPATCDPLLHGHLAAQAEELHNACRSELIDQLPGHMHKALLSGQFSSHQVAASLGMHERTLHRRLNASDTSFRQELDRARQVRGKELLKNTSLPISDIAVALGYSDSSGLIRAFQRWTNTTPSAWRRRCRQAEDDDFTRIAG